MPKTKWNLKKEFEIKAIDALYYFEYKSDFIFQSDYHGDWRLFYVKEGACEISFSHIKDSHIILQKGEIFIEAPEKYYTFKSASGKPCLLFCTGFYCGSPHMQLLSDRMLKCAKDSQHFLSLLIKEGQQSFLSHVSDGGQHVLDRRLNQPFGGEQLTGMYLEMLLISLMRQYSVCVPDNQEDIKEPGQTALSKSDSVLLNRITGYYSSHITKGVSIAELCDTFDIGRSHLQRIFREQTGHSAIDYFCRMRVSLAKQLMQENQMSLTQTARALGYSSVHYFSRQFKKITGIPPSIYQKSIQNAGKNPVYQHIDLDQSDVSPHCPLR